MSAADINIIKRGRGNVLLSSGYQYYRQRVYGSGKSKWRCKNYKELKCAGSINLTEDQNKILYSNPHCEECSPDEAQNSIDLIISECCEEAARGREPAPKVFNRDDAKKSLEELKDYFMDGTLKSCPAPFVQIFSIHGDIGSNINETNIVPLVKQNDLPAMFKMPTHKRRLEDRNDETRQVCEGVLPGPR
ncbi:FLYWCH zinc finger domain-containing protein [Phthorimaea operculella]|nr:FLYWCH zinc finger domain-containing protein [Phthorimaea operculella]